MRVTPEQERLIFSLVIVPGAGPQRRASAEELLAAFGAPDGKDLCGRLLQQAMAERSGRDVELTLIMAATFGLDESSLPTLQSLAREAWHGRHEDISWILEELGGPEVVDDLEFLAWAGPERVEHWLEGLPGTLIAAALLVPTREQVGLGITAGDVDDLTSDGHAIGNAERLHISQSPLSRQIAQLEEKLGLTLFERSQQRIRLTVDGRTFLEELIVI